MDPKGKIAPLALLDPPRIGQQQFLDGLGLTGLGHHPHKVGDGSHNSTSFPGGRN
jgi:hypothetical protein